VLSGNRNFEGRVHPLVKLNYLASPPLVVAYALAGSLKVDSATDPLGTGERRQAGLPEGHLALQQGDRPGHRRVLTPAMFKARYANVFEGPEEWRRSRCRLGQTYMWNPSTYVRSTRPSSTG
jgi:aconitate hydratase